MERQHCNSCSEHGSNDTSLHSSEERSKLEDAAKAVGIFLVCWIGTALACGVLIQLGYGKWIEFFNGGTGFNDFYQSSPSSPSGVAIFSIPNSGGFLAILGFRTLLNSGVALSAVYAAFWIYQGGLKRLLMNKRESVDKMRDLLIAGEVFKQLKSEDIVISDEVIARTFERVSHFDASQAGATVREVLSRLPTASNNASAAQ